MSLMVESRLGAFPCEKCLGGGHCMGYTGNRIACSCSCGAKSHRPSYNDLLPHREEERPEYHEDYWHDPQGW